MAKLLDFLFLSVATVLEAVSTSFVTGIPAVILILGLLMRLVDLFSPGKTVIWAISGGAVCISFVLLLFLMLFAKGMSAGPTPSVKLVEILFLIGVSFLVGGMMWVCYYYWRFVWPVCIMVFLIGLFFCGGIRAIKLYYK